MSGDAVDQSGGTSPSMLQYEREAAKALSGSFGWPTLVLWTCLIALEIAIIAGAYVGSISYWVAVPVLGVLAYGHYTPIHEAVHNNISGGRGAVKWLDNVIGWVSSVPLFSMYPLLRRSHLLHHTYVNTDKDPDAFVRGSLLRLVAVVTFFSFLSFLPFPIISRLFPKETSFDEMTLAEKRGAEITHALYLITLVSLWWAGLLFEAVMLWALPSLIGFLLLTITFSWLPHYPLDKTGRYDHARIARWPGSHWMLLGQDVHLVHHLWPQVPFYRYRKLCRSLKPVLIEKNVRSEGMLVGKYARKLPIE